MNYAAAIDAGESTLAYVALGIAGGYQGHFSLAPYYLKVNEYNHSESRDLWEFDLNLTSAQIRRLVLHLWELRNEAQFNYFFFDENCSYQLLKLLEVARPDWDLTSRFGAFVLPAEAIQAVQRIPGAIGATRRTPSSRAKMLGRLDSLTGQQSARVLSAVRSEDLSGWSARELDGLLALLDYRKHQQGEAFAPAQSRFLEETLRERSRQKEITHPAPPREATSPVSGHGASLLGAVLGRGDAGSSWGLRFRPGLHDWLDRDEGYEPYHQVEVLSGEVRGLLGPAREPRLERLILGELGSLPPWESADPKMSWQLGMRMQREHWSRDAGVPRWIAQALGGAASDLAGLRAYALLGARLDASDARSPHARAMPAGKTGVFWSARSRIKLHVGCEAAYVAADARSHWRHAWSSGFAFSGEKDWQARAEAGIWSDGGPARAWHASFALHRYY